MNFLIYTGGYNHLRSPVCEERDDGSPPPQGPPQTFLHLRNPSSLYHLKESKHLAGHYKRKHNLILLQSID